MVVGGVAILVLAIGFGMGFGGSSVPDVQVNTDGTATVTTEDGATVSTENKLPDTWPADAPTYPGASVGYAGSVDQGANKGLAAVLNTDAKFADVEAYYKKELPAQGWKIDSEQMAGPNKVFTASKGNMMYTIQLAVVQQGTNIAAGITFKE